VACPGTSPVIIGKGAGRRRLRRDLPDDQHQEEAENFVSYCKYPPRAPRSNGPIRSGMYGSAGTYQETGETPRPLWHPMMETKTAVERTWKSILDVDGIAGVYVGRPTSASLTVWCEARP